MKTTNSLAIFKQTATAAIFLTMASFEASAQDTTAYFTGASLSFGVGSSISTSANAVNAATATSSNFSLGAGYGFDIGGSVLTGEYVFKRSSYNGTIVTTGVPFDGTLTGHSVGAKLGYPMGQIMPFVGARIGKGVDESAAGTFDVRSYEISVGAEYALTQNISTTLSYDQLHLNYVNSPLEVSTGVVSLGMVYRF